MVFIQSFSSSIKLKLYSKCVQLLQCIYSKKTMSEKLCRNLFSSNYFNLQKSRSLEIFLMHPSNYRLLQPRPPPYYEAFPPGSSEFNNYHYESYTSFESYWQNHVVANILLPPPPPPPPLPQTTQCFQFQADQSRQYMWRSNSDGNLAKSNAEEVQAVLNLLKARVWEPVEQLKKDKPKPKGFVFSVMSYNVLAQDLISQHPHLYRRHNPNALRWDIRWKNLYQEIKCLQPDIICLQEVQKSHLSMYIDKFKQIGYKGVYKKRTGPTIDGCAIFYKEQLLRLDEWETVEYFQPDVTVLNRNNVAIIAKFVPKLYAKKPFVVATTHLLYNPKRQDVRLAQTQLLLAEIERISFKNTTKNKSPYLPIIITGDFNSEPNSAVYDLLTKGTLKYEHLSCRSLVDNGGKVSPQGKVLIPMGLAVADSCQHAKLVIKRKPGEKLTKSQEIGLTELRNNDREVQEVPSEEVVIEKPDEVFSTGTLSHKFALKSVYTHGEPSNCEATTFQDRWLTVDYIFYSGKRVDGQIKEHKLKLVSRYKLPLRTDCARVNIPNSLLGSDHLCLMSKFRLKVD